MIYILNIDRQPLMPTQRHGKIRRLLKLKQAKVVQRCPFTVQLLYHTNGFIQPITLGVDSGSKTVGISASTEKQELYSSETVLRTDIVELLSTRRESRRTRRNRLRYRKPRFQNRKKADGWLAPSIRHKIDSHLKLVSDIHKILPISKIVVETASFDIQKINNPDIDGVEYQQGNQLGFWNVREYVLFRDGHQCQHCKGKKKDKVLNVHHIESRKTGGDSPNNLITLCETCHNHYHQGKIKVEFKKGKSFRDASFMGIMRWAFYNKIKAIYSNVSMTFGYITKHTRISNNLPKTHSIDAFCIANNINAQRLDYSYQQKFVRSKNRQIHKANILKNGIKKLNQSPKFVFGFQLFDKVLFDNITCFIFGRRSSGYFDLRLLDGSKIHASASYKKLRLLEKRSNLLTQIVSLT